MTSVRGRMTFQAKATVVPVGLLILAMVVLVAGFYWATEALWRKEAQQLAAAQSMVTAAVLHGLENEATVSAGVAAETPGVREAYALATAGQEAEARNRLRAVFAGMHGRITQRLAMEHFKIHFHLPPAKSLLRVWRGPGQGDGGDDISAFRNTVVKVNR